MNLLDLIDTTWGWRGLEPREVICHNEFGNVIVRDARGRYWRVCPEDLCCDIIAENSQALDSLMSDKEFLKDWAMQVLVTQAQQRFGTLTGSNKYGLIVPSVLGGAYAASNMRVLPFAELLRVSGDLGHQIHDLPDGTPIRLTAKSGAS